MWLTTPLGCWKNSISVMIGLPLHSSQTHCLGRSHEALNSTVFLGKCPPFSSPNRCPLICALARIQKDDLNPALRSYLISLNLNFLSVKSLNLPLVRTKWGKGREIRAWHRVSVQRVFPFVLLPILLHLFFLLGSQHCTGGPDKDSLPDQTAQVPLSPCLICSQPSPVCPREPYFSKNPAKSI